MSNKTSDKNVVEYKVELNRNKSIETLKEALNKIEIRGEQLYLLKQAIKHDLAEREQKDKRIQELENKLQDINTYILINGIDEPLRTATQIQVENQHEYMIQQKINKLEEERDNWHGCFIVAMENSIPKQVLIDKIKEYKDKVEQYNEYKEQGKETDVEYYENIANTIVIQVLQELLERGNK